MARTLQQLLALVVVAQPLVILGMNYGLNSITFIQVPAEADGFLSLVQLMWTTSITFLGAIVGSALGAVVAPALGVRRLLILTCPLNIMGGLAAGLGDSFVWILLGRGVTYISIGMSNAALRGFIAEISPRSRRAIYSALVNVMLCLGQIISLFLGFILSWQHVFLLSGFLPSAVCVLGVLFLPSSPKWLLARRRPETEARKALEFYRGEDFDIDGEIKSILESLEKTAPDSSTPPAWRLLWRRETLHPLLLACTQVVIFVWCGGSTLTVITARVFETLDLPLNRYFVAMLPPVVSLVFATAGSVLLERAGRLPMLRLGGTLSAIGCATISAFFFLSAEAQEGFGWIVLIGATLCQIPYSAVIAPLAFGYCVELLPNRTRTLGANIAFAVMYSNFALLAETYTLLQESIGDGGAFMLHAVVSMLQVVFASCCLHETAGLTLEQIQKLFQRSEQTVELPVHTEEAPDASDRGNQVEAAD